jgi:hypothetical protein
MRRFLEHGGGWVAGQFLLFAVLVVLALMNKQEIVASILDRLREEFESRSRVSKITREGGNDTESKAEGRYDTLAIEENYLAGGLARQALAATEAMAEIEKMPLRTFAVNATLDLGALVEIEFPGATVVCAGSAKIESGMFWEKVSRQWLGGPVAARSNSSNGAQLEMHSQSRRERLSD